MFRVTQRFKNIMFKEPLYETNNLNDDKLSKKLKKESGDFLVVFIIMLPILMLLVSFAININQNINLKNNYNSMAQQAATTAVKHADSQGNLGANAVRAFISEYKKQSGIESIEGVGRYTDLHNTKASETECSKMDITENQKQPDGSTKRVVVKKDAEMPYVVIELKKGRGKGNASTAADTSTSGTKFVFEGKNPGKEGSLTNEASLQNISNAFYTLYTKTNAISVTVYNSSSNLFGGFLSGGNCQLHRSQASAVSFASNSDVKTGLL